MAVMTAQPPLPLVPEDARPVGTAAAIVEDDDGGRVFVHGNLVYAWDAGDTAARRLTAVSLMRIKAATQLEVAEAFAVKPATVRRWETRLTDDGVAGLLAERKGPKRKSKLTGDTVAAIRRLRAGGASYRGIAADTGVSVGSVRNALKDTDTVEPGAPTGSDAHLPPEPQIAVEPEVEIEVSAEQDCPATISAAPVTDTGAAAVEAVVPVLADPAPRGAERALARFGLIPAAPPVLAIRYPEAEAAGTWRRRRLGRCIRGRIRVRGRHRPALRLRARAARDARDRGRRRVRSGSSTAMTVHLVREPEDERLGHAARRRATATCTPSSTLRAGQVRGLVLETGHGRAAAARCAPAEVQRLFDDTVAFWKSWLAQSTYTGRWREMVHRSAITLKLMTYAPTGGAGRRADGRAARAGRRRAQLGLPLHLGPGRLVLGLRPARPGLHRGGRGVRAAGCATGSTSRSAATSGPLKIMYRVDGSSDLERGDPRALGGLPRLAARCGSATAPPTSCSSTSTARRWTASTSPTSTGSQVGHQGWLAICEHARLAGRQLGPARGGHLGDPRRPQGLHLRPADVLGRARPRRSGWPTEHGRPAPLERWTRAARRDLRADHGAGLERRAAGVRPALRHRRAGLLAAADAAGRLHRARPTRCGRRRCDAMDDELVTDSLVYRYDPAPRPTGCAARRARSRCARSATSTRWPAPDGSTRPADLREDADLRQPRRPVLRGDRA